MAIFAIAQSLITVVALFDFGVGVHLSTGIIKSLDDGSVSVTNRRAFARYLLLEKRNRIITVGLIQSITFAMIFLFLTNELTDEFNLYLSLLFGFTVLFHSVGLNFGRLFLATGEIAFLVRLQFIGASIAFFVSTLAINSVYNLQISILALSISSIFLGIRALRPESGDLGSLINGKRRDFKRDFIEKGYTRIWYIQMSQLLQVVSPVLIQFILVTTLSPTQVIIYFACQRIIISISSIFGSEIQLNYSIVVKNRRLTLEDVERFKWHYLGFIVAGSISAIVILGIWNEIYSKIQRPSIVTIFSFIPLGLFILLDQAIRFRLYAIGDFRREMLANVVYLCALLILIYFFQLHSLEGLNFYLSLAYAAKMAFSFKI